MNKYILAAVIACAMAGPAVADDWGRQFQQDSDAAKVRRELYAIESQRIFDQFQQELRQNKQERELKDMQDKIKEMNEWPGIIR